MSHHFLESLLNKLKPFLNKLPYSKKLINYLETRNPRKVAYISSAVIIIISFTVYFYGIFFSSNTNFDKNFTEIFIKTGANFSDVKKQLSPYLEDLEDLEKVAYLFEYKENVRSGRFLIYKEMSNYKIIKTLRTLNLPVRVIFNNVERIEDLAGLIASQVELDSLDFMNAVLDTVFLKKNKLNRNNCLALFIPNTYEFFWNTSSESFLNRMVKEYNRFWNETRIRKADSLNLTKEEVITLASIVQKESLAKDEQPRLAGVYINRLKKNMRLQADPTVIYALKKKKKNFKLLIRRVLYKDLRIESPYNTYRNNGLPPGPIITPNITAIDAVLNCKSHSYIYFIADTKKRGYHKFSETLKEHNRNKREYIRWLRKRRIKR